MSESKGINVYLWCIYSNRILKKVFKGKENIFVMQWKHQKWEANTFYFLPPSFNFPVPLSLHLLFILILKTHFSNFSLSLFSKSLKVWCLVKFEYPKVCPFENFFSKCWLWYFFSCDQKSKHKKAKSCYHGKVRI